MKTQNLIRFLMATIFLAAFSVAVQAAEKMKVVYHVANAEKVNFALNTMRVQGVQIDELIPGMIRVDQGGVVRIAELQQQGYLYIRP